MLQTTWFWCPSSCDCLKFEITSMSPNVFGDLHKCLPLCFSCVWFRLFVCMSTILVYWFAKFFCWSRCGVFATYVLLSPFDHWHLWHHMILIWIQSHMFWGHHFVRVSYGGNKCLLVGVLLFISEVRKTRMLIHLKTLSNPEQSQLARNNKYLLKELSSQTQKDHTLFLHKTWNTHTPKLLTMMDHSMNEQSKMFVLNLWDWGAFHIPNVSSHIFHLIVIPKECMIIRVWKPWESNARSEREALTISDSCLKKHMLIPFECTIFKHCRGCGCTKQNHGCSEAIERKNQIKTWYGPQPS